MSSRFASTQRRRWPFVAALVVGLGLIAAPAVFQMFSRAPKGRHMINAFRPFMTTPKITGFQADLTTIEAAVVESKTVLRFDLLVAGVDEPTIVKNYPLLVDFELKWSAIKSDMDDMLRTMHNDIGDFAAVDALPPFNYFPWFFVAPGVLIAGAAIVGIVRRSMGKATKSAVVVLIVLGVGLIGAPAIFQMFGRAPKGAHMINDFRPLMIPAKVQRIQGYFITIGAGEGTIRSQVLPFLQTKAAAGAPNLATQLSAITKFGIDWPSTSNTMAPMIGAMSDNLGNYAAVDALPSFRLFPWFFVAPGVLVALFGVWAKRGWSAKPPPRPMLDLSSQLPPGGKS